MAREEDGAVAERMPDILSAVNGAWRPLREALRRLGDEGVLGVVVGMFRRDALPDGWTFGSGYLPAEGQAWPAADEHNAREAAWARRRSGREVLARFESAHEQLLAILATVTEQEAADHAGYFSGLGAHYAEHQPEIERLISER